MAGQHISERIQQLAREVAGLRRLIEDARLTVPLIALAAGDGSQLNAGVHPPAVRAGDLRPSDGDLIRPRAPIGRMKDAHVPGETRRHQRQNRLAEPAQPRDDPPGRTNIGNSPVHAENYDVRPACASMQRSRAPHPSLGCGTTGPHGRTPAGRDGRVLNPALARDRALRADSPEGGFAGVGVSASA
jgi:hypothetical protein